MKKKLLIELFIYVVLVVIGIVLLFTYKPKKVEIIIPQDFQIEQKGGVNDAALPFEQWKHWHFRFLVWWTWNDYQEVIRKYKNAKMRGWDNTNCFRSMIIEMTNKYHRSQHCRRHLILFWFRLLFSWHLLGRKIKIKKILCNIYPNKYSSSGSWLDPLSYFNWYIWS